MQFQRQKGKYLWAAMAESFPVRLNRRRLFPASHLLAHVHDHRSGGVRFLCGGPVLGYGLHPKLPESLGVCLRYFAERAR
jgi:hypothetical protein